MLVEHVVARAWFCSLLDGARPNKKPRFLGGSGAAQILDYEGILDTIVSQPASGLIRIHAPEKVLGECFAVISRYGFHRKTCR